MNYVDLFLLLALVWAGFRGYRLGFAGLVAGLTGYLVAALLSLNLTDPFVRWLDESFGICHKVANILLPYLPLPRFVLDQELSAPVMKQVDGWLSNWSLPFSLRARLWEVIEKSGGSSATLGETIASELALGLLKILAFLALFYISLWVLKRLAFKFVRSWAATPWSISRVLGLVLGLMSQAIYLALGLGILELGIEKGWFLELPFFLPLARELAASRLTPPLLDLFAWLKGLVDIQSLF
ncbi:MAG: CvpA family protein [Thermanaeromonas sp.]|uniref:CvpA family protein n=1 Tax=Thermanaeromonas sp. TaxID=2003697 RepID=UPI00243DC6DF|nr:CvpA family protein [Thermanaeromonas sp.]MCG0277664.1 CvpA family protein [Thermanaeromonas sp.]